LLRVEDDGPGLAGDAPNETERVGLSNTRARLQHLFPGDHAVRLSASEDGGLRVEIELPAVRSSELRA
jgi:LytS/YehU family sensor histidine kinase